ncbi:zf-MYND domain-containing protein [Phanerochaete sordida]|uniref:Zf-MYND domain-containing protein n=1 Tax=Phanerochaete sordida TaxID=48140 RepID=A0A9P3GP32_9APHY|nr:zf-MYND domain-containing protein [Phanerochaete sordida]
MCGKLDKVQEDFARRVSSFVEEGDTEAEARSRAGQQLAALRWGPTRCPIYNLILVGTVLASGYRERQLALARWLAEDARVPVDGMDVSGAQALHHTLSCAPVFEGELAQILHDAGADVNHRDRHGCTPMHEAMQISDGTSFAAVRPRRDALMWYIAHGGNMDIADNEGTRPRGVLQKSNRLWTTMGHYHTLELVERVEDEDRRRKNDREHCCAFCGRAPEEDKPLLVCSKCKIVRYCRPPRQCQVADWPHHKTSCRKAGSTT